MNKPFNDQPIEVLLEKNFNKEKGVLDLRLKYIGDEGLKYLSEAEELKDLRELNHPVDNIWIVK